MGTAAGLGAGGSAGIGTGTVPAESGRLLPVCRYPAGVTLLGA